MMTIKPSTLLDSAGPLSRPTVVNAGIDSAALFGGSAGDWDFDVEAAAAEETFGVGMAGLADETDGVNSEGIGDVIFTVWVGAQ